MRVTGSARVMWAVALLFLALAPAVFAADDPFSGLADVVQRNVPLWAVALILLSAVWVAGHVFFGSNESGKWFGRFIAGGAILSLTLKGPELLNYVGQILGIGR